jgi:hypothetical protein
MRSGPGNINRSTIQALFLPLGGEKTFAGGTPRMRQRPGLSCISCVLFLATSFLLLSSRNLSAQATAAASKFGDLSTFAAYSRISPDYGPPNGGFTFGAGYTHYLRLPLTPTLEFRIKRSSNGAAVNENTWGGGIRIEHTIQNFHPYGTFLISKGTIHYNFSNPYNPHPTGQPYTQDGSIVYSPGLGVDYDLTYRWAVRADYQFECWNLGYNQTLSPTALTIGVLYRVPAHPFSGER